MKEYYILVYSHIDSVRPNVEAPKIFKSHEEVFDEMCSQLANITEYSVDQLKESYFNGVEIGPNTCVLENSAWYDDCACLPNCSNNWQIFLVHAPD